MCNLKTNRELIWGGQVTWFLLFYFNFVVNPQKRRSDVSSPFVKIALNFKARPDDGNYSHSMIYLVSRKPGNVSIRKPHIEIISLRKSKYVNFRATSVSNSNLDKL